MDRLSNRKYFWDFLERPVIPFWSAIPVLIDPFWIVKGDHQHLTEVSTIRHTDETKCMEMPIPEKEDAKGWDEWTKYQDILHATRLRNTHLFHARPIDIIRHKYCPVCDWEEDVSKSIIDPADSWSFHIYKSMVNAYSGHAISLYWNNEDKARLGDANGNHLDHTYSISEAFTTLIPEHIVGSPVNIRYLPKHENLSKGRRSDQTLDQMLARYNNFSKEHPEWIEDVKYVNENGRFFKDYSYMPNRPTLEQRIARVIETCSVVEPLWNRGLSISEIAKALGWSRPCLTSRLKRHREIAPDSFVMKPASNQRLPP